MEYADTDRERTSGPAVYPSIYIDLQEWDHQSLLCSTAPTGFFCDRQASTQNVAGNFAYRGM
jgi:hypothetical protein